MSPLTNLGLYGDFSFCDKDIIAGLNANFQLLDNLVQLAFTGIVSELPIDPNMGDKYILTTDKTINLWNGSEWITYPAQEGYIGFNKDDELIYFFDGTDWTSLPASAIFFDNTGTGLLATNLQSAVVELKTLNDTTNTNLTTGLADKADLVHTHPLSDLTQSGANVLEVPIWNGTIWSPGPVVPGFQNIVYYSSATTANLNDDIIHLSGASPFNLTLPSAVGIEGKQYTITNQNNSFGVILTVVPSGAETIAGESNFPLYTYQESIKIISNNGNWLLLNHYAETNWIDAGTNTIGATTTNPTKATSIVEDVRYWKRSGDSIRYLMRYKQGASTGATAGSGIYIFEMPTDLEINTSITGTSDPTGTGPNSGFVNQAIGSVVGGYSGLMRPGSLVVRSSGSEFSLYLYSHPNSTLEALRSGFLGLSSGADYFLGVDVTLPILGWRI